jgi:hypothetical protein
MVSFLILGSQMLDLGILNGMQPLQCKLSVRSLPMIRHQKRLKFWSFENDEYFTVDASFPP